MSVDTLTVDAFTYVAELVLERAAIVLETGKEYLVETRLRPLVRRFKTETIDGLVKAARGFGSTASELQDAIVESLRATDGAAS